MKTKHFIYFVLATFLFLGCSNDESGNGEGGGELYAPKLSVCKVVDSTTVFLSWSSVTDAETYVVYYYDYTENEGTKYVYTQTESKSCFVYGLTPNTDYGFVVIAKAGSKESEMSNMKEVTTLAEY